MPSESIVVNYAKVKAKSVDVERDIVSHNNDGSTSTTLRFTNTNTADRILTIPAISANANVMTSESSLAPDKLNINGATAETSPASTDEFIFYDASASANRKIPFSNLKSAIDTTLDINSLTAQTVAGVAASTDMMVVYDASADDNKKLSVDTLKQINYAGISNDATVSSAGALSLADKPSAKKTAEANKFLHCDASKDIDGLNAVGCANLTGSGTVQGANVRATSELLFGTNKWKIAQSGNNLQILEYNGSAWVVKFQIEGAGQS